MKDDHGIDEARAQYGSIKAMVAALEVDYTALASLRDARAAHGAHGAHGAGDWAQAYPDDAALLQALEHDAGECTSFEDARMAIECDPLDIRVRSGRYTPGQTPDRPTEFEILLQTGGPAVRIIGDIDYDGSPVRPRIEYQDWFTPWTEFTDGVHAPTLRTYCAQFYFGGE